MIARARAGRHRYRNAVGRCLSWLRRLGRRPEPTTPRWDCARAGHRFGPWLVCACNQTIADHIDPADPAGGFFGDGSCAFEFRCCPVCRADQERHVTDVPTVPDLGDLIDEHIREHRAGGHLRQDVPAGPVARTTT
ncbi:MAG: hypothetical protein ACRDRK_03405 [Pseudonocardia sp.]